jgi:hypothetical protein
MGFARLYFLMLALCVVTLNCGGGDSSRGVRVQYRVSYADDSHGKADVAYRTPDGHDVSDKVNLPWTSQKLIFPPDGRVVVRANAPAAADAALQCSATTDQGPSGREAASSGLFSCSVDSSLSELGRRS